MLQCWWLPKKEVPIISDMWLRMPSLWSLEEGGIRIGQVRNSNKTVGEQDGH